MGIARPTPSVIAVMNLLVALANLLNAVGNAQLNPADTFVVFLRISVKHRPSPCGSPCGPSIGLPSLIRSVFVSSSTISRRYASRPKCAPHRASERMCGCTTWPASICSRRSASPVDHLSDDPVADLEALLDELERDMRCGAGLAIAINMSAEKTAALIVALEAQSFSRRAALACWSTPAFDFTTSSISFDLPFSSFAISSPASSSPISMSYVLMSSSAADAFWASRASQSRSATSLRP